MSGHELNLPFQPKLAAEAWLDPWIPQTSFNTGYVPSSREPKGAAAKDVTEEEIISKTLTFPETSGRKCKVPGCPLQNCNLGTHQNYDSKAARRKQSRQRTERGAHEALKQIELYNKEAPSVDGVDGFPALPIEEALDHNIRSLFHYFFSDTFDKLALLFRGPSVTNMVDFKERMLATALSSEAYCRSLILQARTEQDSAKGVHEETEEALNLNNSTLKAFREQLAIIHKRPHPVQIELALLVLCCLLMYDAAYGRDESQRVHWQGMQDLVSLRGGMHCVTVSLAYVIHADRACAVRFETMPTYTNTSVEMLPMPIPSPTSLRYGSKFHIMRNHSAAVDSTVNEYLVDVSGLVELWEEARTPASTKRNRGPHGSLEYLHYSRDRLDQRFAVLHANWAKVESMERLLLWTSRLVEYPCTWSNYVRTNTQDLCRRLTTVLDRQRDLLQVWQSDLDTLRWILFALVVIGTPSDHRAWAVSWLRKLLQTKHGAVPWPSMWWADEQENLLRFIWSSSQYASGFRAACDELEVDASDSAGSE